MRADPANDRLLPAATAAAAVGVSPTLLLRWRDKGWLDPATGQRKFLPVADETPTGRKRYRLGDVRQADRETWQSNKSHRMPLAVSAHNGPG